MILKALAWLVMLFGLLYAAKYLLLGGPYASGGAFSKFWHGHIEACFSAAMRALIQGLLLLGASESILVLLDIEENTRRGADAASGVPAANTPQA